MKQTKEKRRQRISKIMAHILFVSLAVSAVFSLIRLIQAPEAVVEGDPHQKVKSDYLLMVVECCLGLVVILLPSAIARRWKLEIPNFVYVLYYVFLYCAVFLGEVLSFYYLVPHWDTILHFFSGTMLGALGFILVDWLNREEKVRVNLSPLFVSLFAFCFALAIGTLWEIYEYTCDTLLHLNMQKYMTEAGEELVGRAALQDTMGDILTDTFAALLVAGSGYFSGIKMRLEAKRQMKNAAEK